MLYNEYILLTKDILGFETKFEYYIKVEDEYSQPTIYRCKNDEFIKKKIIVNKHDGYQYVNLGLIQGKRKLVAFHRIVAQTFTPNYENKPCVDHIDTNRLNNCISNLRWATQKENSNNEISRQHYSNAQKGKSKPNSMKKQVVRLTLDGTFVKEYESILSVKQEGFDGGAVWSCCSNRPHCKTHKGYKWMYLEDYNKIKKKGAGSN